MANSRYAAVSNHHDEDNDNLILRSASDNAGHAAYEDPNSDSERSRSVSPLDRTVNPYEPVTTSSLLDRVYEASTTAIVEEDIPFHRTRATDTPADSEDKSVRGTGFAKRLSDGSSIKNAFSPSTHHPRRSTYEKLGLGSLEEAEPSETARLYNFWKQTRRLWRLAAVELLATVALCGAFAALLFHYDAKEKISHGEMIWFNAASTILSFLLGANLANSMKSYAKLLRWWLLSLCWQPLETFDLVVGCDSLFNVCKLIVKSWRHKSRRLRFGSMGVAFLWLFLTVVLTFLVGTIGLSYGNEPSTLYMDTVPGKVQFTNFSSVNTSDFSAAASQIQQAGVRGWTTDCDDLDGGSQSDSARFCGLHGSAGHGSYSLLAYNPSDSSMGMYSLYYVPAGARCTERTVVNGSTGDWYDVAYIDDRNTTQHLRIASNAQNLPHEGGIVAVSEYNSIWTGTATYMYMFFPRANSDLGGGQLFVCEVWLMPVRKDLWPKNASELAPLEYQIDNTTSRMLAAAMGWNGDTDIVPKTNDVRFQSTTYKEYLPITRSIFEVLGNQRLSPANVSNLIVSFTLSALSALDTRPTGINKFKEIDGDVPVPAQILKVKRATAIGILATIPVVQFLACVAVFACANRAIIKDDSPLSIAKLYWTILDKYNLGKRGCMLKGSEIVKFISKQTGDERGPMVTYGWKWSHLDSQNRLAGYLDVFEQNEEGKGATTSGTWQSTDSTKVKNEFWTGIQYDGPAPAPETAARERFRQRNYDLS